MEEEGIEGKRREKKRCEEKGGEARKEEEKGGWSGEKRREEKQLWWVCFVGPVYVMTLTTSTGSETVFSASALHARRFSHVI